jgi:tetratricopeptide (TPR) repeat protein
MTAARFILFLSLLALAAPALADQRKPRNSEAQRFLAEGNRLYRVRDFAPAIEKYREGARLEDAPVFWYNLGQSHRQLAQYEEAIWFYRRYLSEGNPSPEERSYLEGFIGDMQREREKAAASAAPTAPGPIGTVPAVEIAQAPPATEPTPPPIVPVSDPPPAPRWYHDKVGWALAGGGLALGITGIALLAQASAKESSAYGRPDWLASAASLRTWGTVVGLVGVGALTVGVVKLVRVPRPAVEPVAFIGGGSWLVGAAGRF